MRYAQLQQLALKVLSQPSSASSSEQNWSQYDFVHDKRRNRLKSEAASKLVFVYTTIRACLKQRCYKRHLEFLSTPAVSPGSIVSPEDAFDGNASDDDLNASEPEESDDEVGI